MSCKVELNFKDISDVYRTITSNKVLHIITQFREFYFVPFLKGCLKI